MDAGTQTSKGSVLIVDADPLSRSMLQADLGEMGWEVLVADRGQAGLEILQARPVSVALLDLRTSDMSGVAWMQQARMLCAALPVVAVAAAPTVEMAVEAMRSGACDVLAKPLSSKAVAKRLQALAPVCAGTAGEAVRFGRCVTVDPTLAGTLQKARQLAGAGLVVAICGAPGSGRKTLAASMHEVTPPQGPITVLDVSLLNPEQARGKLDQIDGAGARLTVADVQCLKLPEQDRLATVLAARVRAGLGTIVTLANRPERLAGGGQLSKPLAEILAETVLQMPPLAGRRVDLPVLARQMLAEMFPQAAPELSPAAMEALMGYDWPGNIRQLRLVLERAGRLSGSGPVEPRHLPILQAIKRDSVASAWPGPSRINLQEAVDGVERHLIAMALRQTNQNQAKAAEVLGIPRTTLRDKLAKHGFLTPGAAESPPS